MKNLILSLTIILSGVVTQSDNGLVTVQSSQFILTALYVAGQSFSQGEDVMAFQNDTGTELVWVYNKRGRGLYKELDFKVNPARDQPRDQQ